MNKICTVAIYFYFIFFFCMWALASERSIYLTRAPFTCGHMGHAFWTCPLKVAGVGMGSPRLARIIGFLGCTQ